MSSSGFAVDLCAEDLGCRGHVSLVAFETLIGRLQKPGFDPVARRVVFEFGVVTDSNRVHIAAVVRLQSRAAPLAKPPPGEDANRAPV